MARRVVGQLLAFGGEVRAYSAGDVASLKAQGAIVASGTSDDEGRLEAAMTHAHTVVHLGRGLLEPDPRRVIAEATTMVTAASNASVARIIAVSLPGASVDASDPLRAAYGHLEALLEQTDVPTIVVRPSLVWTSQVIDAIVTCGLAPPQRDVEVAPIVDSDLVELIVALDDARSRATTGHLVTAADGPVITTLGDVVQQASGPPTTGQRGSGGPTMDLVGRTLVDAATASTIAAALDGPWTTTDPLVVDAWQLMKLTPQAPAPIAR